MRPFVLHLAGRDGEHYLASGRPDLALVEGVCGVTEKDKRGPVQRACHRLDAEVRVDGTAKSKSGGEMTNVAE